MMETDLSTTPGEEKQAGTPLYELSGLERTFTKGGTVVHAVRGINLVIDTRGRRLKHCGGTP